MNEIKNIRDITINEYIKEIQKLMQNGLFLSALTTALIIPDICSKYEGNNNGYVKWFNKYVYKPFYEFPIVNDKNNKAYELYQIKLNGNVCKSLRNAILHSGTCYVEFEYESQKKKARIDEIQLCINSKSSINKQYGQSVSIINHNETTKTVIIRIEILTLINNIIKGYNIYNHDNKEQFLFSIIDWDKE